FRFNPIFSRYCVSPTGKAVDGLMRLFFTIIYVVPNTFSMKSRRRVCSGKEHFKWLQENNRIKGI
ncbi:MAG TPA: hypothetical protein VNE41_01830, partial [Chitinophagaceae bacterium]|nr:hypothetical protein [Chitinophagaceae bacterium]